MNIPSLTEILIVALGFSVVGAYVLACRHFINASEAEPVAPPQPRKPSANASSAPSRPAHA